MEKAPPGCGCEAASDCVNARSRRSSVRACALHMIGTFAHVCSCTCCSVRHVLRI